MNPVNVKISDINTGLKGYIRYSLQQSKNESLKELSLNERMAIITYYLHNKGTKYARPFEEIAIKLMNDICEWKMKRV